VKETPAMIDNVLELRAWADNDADTERATMMRMAADEIESLRAMLRRIDDCITWETTPLGRQFQGEVEAILTR
jgi:seryl-tRNA(Sec) selenium transferase